MSIENRINKVDLNEQPVDSSYRAAIHKKFSNLEIKPETLKAALLEDFTQPLDAAITKKLHEINERIVSVFDNKEIIRLSPLGASGLDQYLTKTSSLKIAHVTGRNADVVADPTIQLAAEAYRRRRIRDTNDIALGTQHMCMRLQRYSSKSFKPYFEMFSTMDSSINSSFEFESDRMVDLISRYAQFLKVMCPDKKIEIVFSNLKITENILVNAHEELDYDLKQKLLDDKLPENFRGILPETILNDNEFKLFIEKENIFKEILSIRNSIEKLKTKAGVDSSLQLNRVMGLGHYNGLVFKIDVDGADIVDGGSVDWVSKLTSNQKERTVVSGFGTQMLANLTLDNR